MADFTPTQGRYLSYILAYTDGFGLPPAESEIARALGVSPPSVNQMMKTLEKRSLIHREPGVARSIEILIDPDTIPPWRKRIARTMKVWMRDEPVQEVVAPATRRRGRIYQFKIVLRDTRPAIWRRIETGDATLEQLHELIQTGMGWTNSHLHQFEIAGTCYTHPRFMADDFGDSGAEDYSGLRVSDLVAEHGSKLRLRYEYDFGDGWEHDVILEKVTDPEPRARYPRCTAGKGACPPEDVGGVYAYADYVAAITNPQHSEHEYYLEWSGPFDPAEFDAVKTTRQMRRGLPVW